MRTQWLLGSLFPPPTESLGTRLIQAASSLIAHPVDNHLPHEYVNMSSLIHVISSNPRYTSPQVYIGLATGLSSNHDQFMVKSNISVEEICYMYFSGSVSTPAM